MSSMDLKRSVLIPLNHYCILVAKNPEMKLKGMRTKPVVSQNSPAKPWVPSRSIVFLRKTLGSEILGQIFCTKALGFHGKKKTFFSHMPSKPYIVSYVFP